MELVETGATVVRGLDGRDVSGVAGRVIVAEEPLMIFKDVLVVTVLSGIGVYVTGGGVDTTVTVGGGGGGAEDD